jgi:lysophospholipase L1-like esterase
VAGESEKTTGTKKRLLLNFLCVIISLMIAFGIAEVAVRIYAPQEVAPIRFKFDPQLGDIPTPNQRGRKIRPGVFDYTFSHNSLGLRGSKEYSLQKNTEHRLLFLGDSFTYGFGVSDDQTFAYLTEKRLLNDRLSVEVINSGNSGRGTDYELKFYQVVGYKFNPDLVILCFCANDFIDNERGEFYRVSADGEISFKPLNNSRKNVKIILYYLPGYNWLVSWSQAANFVKEKAVLWFIGHADPAALKEGPIVITYPQYFQGYVTEDNKRLTEIYVKNLVQSVKNAGGSLMIVYIPMSVEVDAYKKNSKISNDEKAIQQLAQKYGERLFSLTPVFAASPEPLDQLYFLSDGHWTAAGHALAARYLSEQIGDRLKKN